MDRRDRRTGSGEAGELTPIHSYTNLAKFLIRRPHPENCNNASGNYDDTPPKTPNRSVPSLRAASGTVAGVHLTTTTSDKGKQLLIDQFYNAINEKNLATGSPIGHGNGGSGGSNYYFADAGDEYISSENSPKVRPESGVFGGGIITPMVLSGHGAESGGNMGSTGSTQPLLDSTFKDILKQGGTKYLSMDYSLLNDEELVTYLLNIDNIVTREAYDQKMHVHQNSNNQQQLEQIQDDPLKPVEIILTNLSNVVTESIQKQIVTPMETDKTKSQIEQLRNYVVRLQHETEKLATELKSNKEITKTKYQNEINLNVEKLKNLTTTLEELETRLNKLKDQISSNKSKMNTDITQKLKVLEHIDKRMIAYTADSKERRIKLVSTTFAVLILLISVWWGLS